MEKSKEIFDFMMANEIKIWSSNFLEYVSEKNINIQMINYLNLNLYDQTGEFKRIFFHVFRECKENIKKPELKDFFKRLLDFVESNEEKIFKCIKLMNQVMDFLYKLGETEKFDKYYRKIGELFPEELENEFTINIKIK